MKKLSGSIALFYALPLTAMEQYQPAKPSIENINEDANKIIAHLSQYNDDDVISFNIIRKKLPIIQNSIDPAEYENRYKSYRSQDKRDIRAILPLGRCIFGGKHLNSFEKDDEIFKNLYTQENIEKILIFSTIGALKTLDPILLSYIDPKTLIVTKK